MADVLTLAATIVQPTRRLRSQRLKKPKKKPSKIEDELKEYFSKRDNTFLATFSNGEVNRKTVNVRDRRIFIMISRLHVLVIDLDKNGLAAMTKNKLVCVYFGRIRYIYAGF